MMARTLNRVLFFLLCILLLVACESRREPIQLGFIAGMSGRVADLGVSGRNGVQLAVEQRNAAGGINGRQVNLVVRDDEQNPETAKRVVGELLAQGIELIIGPMTSSMAMAMMPQVDASSAILLSPTVTTTELSGKDDNFLRVISTTRDYASKTARYQFEKLGIRSVAALYDIGNRAYTESWLRDFRQEFEELGGKVLLQQSFQSGQGALFGPLAEQLLATGADAIAIISNAVDSALFCQQVRKMVPDKPIVMSEWASTERFTELAGGASEGVVVSQFMNRNDSSSNYLQFVDSYRNRFNQDPGFAGLAGYDAGLVALEALAERREGQTLKQTIIDKRNFQGGQQVLEIDRFGDSNRETFVTVIRNNQYITVE